MNHLVLEVGLALGLVATAALISARLRFSVVPFLILTGMTVGPHAPHIGPFDFRFIQSASLIEFMGRIGVLVVPFRDFFGAIFFFGFGLTIDPFALGGAVWPVVGAVLVTLAGNVVAGVLAGRCAKLGPAASLNIGLTIVSRGEFSIIMANLARSGGLLPVIQPFAALYVLILAVLGPLLTRESERIYELSSRLLKGRAAREASREAELQG